MRKVINMNAEWSFNGADQKSHVVNVPHTWNELDGQDGGNDYYRGTGVYEKQFECPKFHQDTEEVYLVFHGVNSSCDICVNEEMLFHHDGGYSTFRVNITKALQKENTLQVVTDNAPNDKVYPQKADFTFYGGIYRDVELMTVSKSHFELDYFGGNGLKVTPIVEGKAGKLVVETWNNDLEATVHVTLFDAEGNIVSEMDGDHAQMQVDSVRLWDGIKDPYLYTVKASLVKNGEVVDEVCTTCGFRTFHVDPDKGFFLNGRSYPLRGVSRHQDFKGLGNAITKEYHDRDMEMIREIGANTIRLAHYQHDQYFYDLCDRYGMVVWAEIPYISEHMPNGRENTFSQMKELIVQNYNHPSIVCWGLSNEITISTKNHKDMMDNHHALNDLVHDMDKTRLTTLACYAMCLPWDSVVHKTSDLVSYNLYLGWYVPGLFLNDWFLKGFHKVWKNRCIGYSEYGAEGMPNLHSSHPRRNDHTEEYQAIYHEYMLECFERNSFLWATHVWNMFDFAADARDQGGEPGMNHKGLVTFDRKTKKDSFYLYKAYWSEEPFVHLTGSRYMDRTEEVTEVKVYSNQKEVSLYNNGKLIETKQGDKVFRFQVKLEEENNLQAVSNDFKDESLIRKVATPNPAYRLPKKKKKTRSNWV